MIISNLGRKVLNQTELPQDLITGWWVEKRLQLMRIGGLVKMINQSKSIDLSHIDKYIPQYKWAYRPLEERLYIIGHVWMFDLLQFLSQDFPWGEWQWIITLDVDKDYILFKECLHLGMGMGDSKNNLSYVKAIFNGKRQDFLLRINEAKSQIVQCPILNIESNIKSEDSKNKWDSLKDKI